MASVRRCPGCRGPGPRIRSILASRAYRVRRCSRSACTVRAYVFTQQTALLLRVTLITMAIGLVYWLAVILPQRGRARHLLDAASGGVPAAEPAGAPAETA